MPIYEYYCKKCDQTFDIMQKISDPKISECPNCGFKNMEKLVSATRFKLKGTGWYEADFKDKKSSTPPPSTPAPCSSGSCPS